MHRNDKRKRLEILADQDLEEGLEDHKIDSDIAKKRSIMGLDEIIAPFESYLTRLDHRLASYGFENNSERDTIYLAYRSGAIGMALDVKQKSS